MKQIEFLSYLDAIEHNRIRVRLITENGDKEKQVIEVGTLKNASQYAEQDLKDRWEWYRERYIKKLKK